MKTNRIINTESDAKNVFAVLWATEKRTLRRTLVVQLPADYSDEDIEMLSGVQLSEWASMEPTSSSFELDDGYEFEVSPDVDVLDVVNEDDEDVRPDLVLVRGDDGRLVANTSAQSRDS